jgi:putative ABC transport system permease protein
VGVAPPHLLSPGPGFMAESDYWIPIEPRSANFRGNLAFYAIGRLRDGVTFEQAQADLSRVMAQLVREYPNGNTHRGVLVRPLAQALTAQTRALIVMLYGAAILVLLIAAANILNLQLVRVAARERDLVVRSALGATKRRLAAQMVLEMGLLSAGGLIAAVAAALGCFNAVDAFFVQLGRQYGVRMIVPGWEHVGLSIPVLCYAIALTLLFTVAVAALPVYLRSGNPASLVNVGRSGSAGGRARLRTILVVAQLVFAFAVVCAGILLLQSFARLERTPVGFTEHNVYTVSIDLPHTKRYIGYGALERFYTRAESAIRGVPGVADAGEAFVAGLGSQSNTDYSIAHRVDVKTSEPARTVETNSVSPRFFSTVQIPLLRGRVFTADDTESAQPAAVVSRSFAIANFGSVNAALGKHVSIADTTDGRYPMRRIVGVVGDVRHFLADKPRAEVYVPFAQVIFPGEIVLRTTGDAPHLAGDLAAALSKIDPTLAPPQVVSFSQMRSVDEFMTRIAAIVFVSLAGIALLLALAGIYGVVAYSVERRTHEFGIRMSLGAHASAIARGVLREAVLLALAGIALGTILAAVAARGLAQMLYQTSPLDPPTFVGAALFLLSAVVLATAVPTMRAMRVQPATALRYE